MFYAPWCGHCKKLKPEYVTAAATMKEEEVNGILAAVDATKEKKLGERFTIKGYPTVKYFRDGVEAWDINVRTGDKVVEFMKDPKQPPPPPPEEVPWESVPSRVEHLNDESFKTFLKKKKHALVMFYAPWCGHCKKAKPEFMNAAEKFKEDNKVAFSAVDCTKNAKLCETHEVSGYPTFKYFNYGKNDQKYTGGREENDFVAFMSDPLNPLASVPSQSDPRKHWSDVPGFESVRLLTEANFDATIADNPSVLVMFYAPWCGHCQAMRPAFASAASVMKTKNIAGVLAAVDAVAEASLASRYAIKGFPTIKYFKGGKEAFDYELSRSAQDFINFMENPTPKYESWASEPNIPGSMRHLTHSNFDVFLAGKQRVLVMFYVPANPQCEELKPIYFAAAEQLVGVADAALTVVDCSANSDLCSKNNVGQYPSIKLYVRGSFVSDFVGSRSVDELLRFVKGSPSDKTEL
jgi:protein disulfide-isomerase-like protein